MMKKKHTDFPILLAECKFAKISCPLDWKQNSYILLQKTETKNTSQKENANIFPGKNKKEV